VIDVRVGTVGLFTVNVKAFVGPCGVFTMTFLAPSTVVEEMVKVAVIVESFTTVKELTGIPFMPMIEVAPVRPEPEMVTGTVAPRTPVAGVIVFSTGPRTVYTTELLVPPSDVTVTFLGPRAAANVVLIVALMVVEFTTVTPVTDTLVPETATVVPAVVKLVPVRTTGTLCPRTPDAGAIDVRVGTGGLTMAKVTVLLVPLGVVTDTLRTVATVL
jgi:hypothetical protein